MIAAHTHHLVPSTVAGARLLDGWISRITHLYAVTAESVRRAACGVRGHDMLFHFESTRLSLQCASCGQQTPGWAIQNRG